MSKTVYQYTPAGLYLWETQAEESPREPGVYLLPARCTETPPPDFVPSGQWPRWDGTQWALVPQQAPSTTATEADPVDKLKAFLANNPDVAALLASNGAA